MKKDLYIMTGVPGSGKSTYLMSSIKLDRSWIISRDEIRFGILEEGDEYFSKEEEVYDIFVDRTNAAIDDPIVNKIYCDATFQTPKSRAKFLNRLFLENVDIHIIYVKSSLETCLKNNRQRTGLSRVKDHILKEIYNKYVEPTFNEQFAYKDILVINGDINNDMVNK